MATLKQVTAKAAAVHAIDERIDELQAQKALLQSQIQTINTSLDERRAARDVEVAALRALIADLP